MRRTHRSLRTLLPRTLLRGVCGAAAFLLMAGAVRAQDEEQMPSGWMGVYVARGPEGTIIQSVSPDAPAQKAGLAAGDTILSYNGIDAHYDGSDESARRVLAFRQLLTPGRHIKLRVRRNGVVRTATVVVAKRHESDDVVVEFPQPSEPPKPPPHPKGVSSSRITIQTDSTSVSVQFGSPLIPMLLMSGTMIQNGVVQFAGASLTPVTSELADVLHTLSEGMLVIAVAPSSPARVAGLKGGDVILKVDSVRKATPTAFLELLDEKQAEPRAQRISFSVFRNGKTRRIALRW